MIATKLALQRRVLASVFTAACLTGVVHAAIRSAPKSPIVIESSSLSVVLDPSDALPYQYRFGKGNIWGEDSGSGMTAIVCQHKPRVYASAALTPSSAKAGKSEVSFSFEPAFHGQTAASFVLKYSLNGASLTLTMEEVHEQPGFELIEVSIPDLATVREEDGPGWLAHGNEGGSVVDLSQSKPYRIPEDRFFGKIAHVLPVAMIGSGSIASVMEVSAFMDGMDLEIAGENGRRHARMGTVETYRVHGGRSYEMNDLGPRIAGNENTPNLLVGQTPRCRMDFFGDVDGDGTVDWLDGAKVVRQRMPPIPTHYFDDKLLYMIGGKYKLEAEPRTTFAQGEQLVRDIAMLTDYAPQVALVGGWDYEGQDTGYPAEDKVNDSMGGYDALLHFISTGPKFNANVSLNTNYDDAYMESPKWDPSTIARRPDGAPWKSRDWAGEISYIVGLAKYMQGPGVARVDEAVKRYNLHDAILVDALSWYAIRNDWDAEHPASGYKNLVEGRYRVLEEFRQRGVNVLSEQLRYPYLGKLALSVDGVSGSDDPFGGQSIPLLPALYRKSAIWGSGGASLKDVPRNLFWNSRPGPWYINATDRGDIADFYFLTVLPWIQIHDSEIESYKREGDRSTIGLSRRSKLEVNWMTRQYSVVVDGVEVASEKGTFCPLDQDRIAFFSRDSRSLQAELPAGWDASRIAGWVLFTDHREPFEVKVEQSKISVDVPAGRPVIVYRDAIAAGKHRGG
jgi:Endo-alpha-N-acetylgalactosaminidase